MSNGLPPLTLGALDLSPVFRGMKPVDAIAMTLEIAPMLEAFGYSRYWLAEHHGPKVAHSSPELLVSIIAARTQRMHIGTAGILLRLHSPLKVAKNFRLLHSIFPDRIDLGIARGGTAPEQEILLRSGASEEVTFESKVSDLLAYLRETTEVVANPQGVRPPQIWMLGSNATSMHLATLHGTAFCFASFLANRAIDPADVLKVYRAEFLPSADFPEPKGSIAFAGVCANTDARAEELAQQETPIGLFPTIVGSQKSCGHAVRELHLKTGITEFVFLDLCHRFEDKLESYRLLAEELL